MVTQIARSVRAPDLAVYEVDIAVSIDHPGYQAGIALSRSNGHTTPRVIATSHNLVFSCKEEENTAGPAAKLRAKIAACHRLGMLLNCDLNEADDRISVLRSELSSPFFGRAEPAGEDWHIEVKFTAGWCKLFVSAGGYTAVVSSTGIEDSFARLARGLSETARGERTFSVFWSGEPGGVFLDFSSNNDGSCCLVIHEASRDGWIGSSISAPWLPERGEVLFSSTVDRNLWISESVALLQGAREYSDNLGQKVISGWPYQLPRKDLEDLKNLLLPT